MKKIYKRIKYIDSNLIDEQSSDVARPVEIEATGFVVKQTQKYITIAREIVHTEFGIEYRGQLSIPRVAIL